MKISPMLAKKIVPADVEFYINSDDWFMQQKLDGVRLIAAKEEEKVFGLDRKATIVALPPSVESDMNQFPGGPWAIDGELLGETFVAFDLILARGHPVERIGFAARSAALRAILKTVPNIQFLAVFKTTEEKSEAFARAEEEQIEGVMFRNVHAPYAQRRSDHLIKCKFVTTVDCIIHATSIEERRNIGVGLMENGRLVDIGSVGVVNDVLTQCEIGQVVEIKYLYATDARRLYQPSFVRFRTDKLANECTFDQLKYTNRELLTTKGAME